MRSALIWARRLPSSMIRPGQARLISSSLPTTAPFASISAIRTSKARPPSSIGRPSAKTSRRCGKILKRPISTLAGASDTESTRRDCSANFPAISQLFASGAERRRQIIERSEQREMPLKESCMATDFGGLVDAENGLISRCIFIEPEIYAQELEQIFGACWLFLYHETQIPQPGDFFTTYMGEDPILVRRMGSVSPVVGTLFPNFPLLRAGSRTFRVWHPRRGDKTEVWSWVYVDKAAPPHVKEAIGLAGIRG